jgi:tetratricopeptide (TPR) repeat protein
MLAGFSLSCVHQSQTVSGIPPLPTPKAEKSTKQASAMERQISNATDAGEGDYAVRALRQKMAAEPENLAVRLELIEHYTRAGYPELALEHCRLAATRFPESADVQLRMAKLLDGMNMGREAADGLAAFLAAHPQKTPEYESWVGILRDGFKDWPGGEKAHRAALALDTDRDSLHNNLGYNLLMQGRPKEAAQEFREALKLRPDSEVARNNLGMALAAGPPEAAGAEATSNDALLHWQSISDPATAHSNMAALLIGQKRYAEARRELDLALGYNKSHTAALANLKLVSELDGKPAVIPIKPVQTKWSRFRSTIAKIVGG